MSRLSYFLFIFSLVFSVAWGASETGRMVQFLMGENNLLNCISDFNEDCINSYGRKPIERFLSAAEIPIDSYISLEKLGHDEKRESIKNLWSFTELTKTVERFMKDHALKVKIGNMVGRVFESRSQPDNLEFTIDAVGKSDSVGTGKSQRLYRVVIPLVMGFKVTGMIIFGIFAVKLFLVKATLVANAALLVSGFIVLKKLYDHGMNMLNSHHSYLTTHQAIPSYYHKEEPNLSGYGYGYGSSYDHGNLGAYSTNEVSDHSALSDSPAGDLQGHYSHHAIAMAALNKTLMSRPKRRWSVKWSGRR